MSSASKPTCSVPVVRRPDVDAGRRLQLGHEGGVPRQRGPAEPQQLLLAVGGLGDRRQHAGRGLRGARARAGVDDGDREPRWAQRHAMASPISPPPATTTSVTASHARSRRHGRQQLAGRRRRVVRVGDGADHRHPVGARGEQRRHPVAVTPPMAITGTATAAGDRADAGRAERSRAGRPLWRSRTPGRRRGSRRPRPRARPHGLGVARRAADEVRRPGDPADGADGQVVGAEVGALRRRSASAMSTRSLTMQLAPRRTRRRPRAGRRGRRGPGRCTPLTRSWITGAPACSACMATPSASRPARASVSTCSRPSIAVTPVGVHARSAGRHTQRGQPSRDGETDQRRRPAVGRVDAEVGLAVGPPGRPARARPVEVGRAGSAGRRRSRPATAAAASGRAGAVSDTSQAPRGTRK